MDPKLTYNTTLVNKTEHLIVEIAIATHNFVIAW
jgi:hypothetical protein